MKVIVASQNPVKVNAVKHGFSRMFPDEEWEVAGLSVSSGVPDQPMGDDETIQGARNRAEGAKQIQPEADFWVGIEGGVDTKEQELEAFAWIVIEGKNGQGKARTSAFFLPPAVAALVHGGKELGHATDEVFHATNSKQNNGSIGILTDDLITREIYYIEAVTLALIPFKNPELYFTAG